jgi:hypothetical protein
LKSIKRVTHFAFGLAIYIIACDISKYREQNIAGFSLPNEDEEENNTDYTLNNSSVLDLINFNFDESKKSDEPQKAATETEKVETIVDYNNEP